MERKLLIKTADDALKIMTATLAANMIDNELVTNKEHKHEIKLGWLTRKKHNRIGCPCFICEFDGLLPSGERLNGIVYVKTFASKKLLMCKLEHWSNVAKFEEISEGQSFTMAGDDRFEEEKFILQNGEIKKI